MRGHRACARKLAGVRGWVTTYYTCCANVTLNIFTNSHPAEAACLPIYAAKVDLDGYLHWAWMNWDEHP